MGLELAIAFKRAGIDYLQVERIGRLISDRIDGLVGRGVRGCDGGPLGIAPGGREAEEPDLDPPRHPDEDPIAPVDVSIHTDLTLSVVLPGGGHCDPTDD